MKNSVLNQSKLSITAVLFFCIALLLTFSAKAQPQVSFSPLIQNLSAPVDLKNAGDGTGRLFIVEQGGIVKIYKNGKIVKKAFLDISSLIAKQGDEQGLLSIAFDPKYKKNRTFFVYYTGIGGAITIASYKTSTTNADSALPSSAQVLLTIPKNEGSLVRNGGDLHFGNDGYLYIFTGDGGTGSKTFGNAVSGQSLLGKVLRIKVNATTAPYYTIPPDNPYLTDANVKDEIWSLGLRQPWRNSFDKLTGDLWIGDVGQTTREEINFRTPAQSAGTNYGWSCYEGDSTYKLQGCGTINNYTFPIFAYSNNSTTGGHAVVGGYVYRGTVYPALQGYYICADYAAPHNVWKIKSNGAGGFNVYPQPGTGPVGIVSFGQGQDGELYAVSVAGTVYKVQSTGAVAATRSKTQVEPTPQIK